MSQSATSPSMRCAAFDRRSVVATTFEACAITSEAIDKPAAPKPTGEAATPLGLSQPHHAEDHAADAVAMMVVAVMTPRAFVSLVGQRGGGAVAPGADGIDRRLLFVGQQVIEIIERRAYRDDGLEHGIKPRSNRGK